jgi:hypothetical protein
MLGSLSEAVVSKVVVTKHQASVGGQTLKMARRGAYRGAE